MKTPLIAIVISALAAGAAAASAVAPISTQAALGYRGKCVAVTGVGSVREDLQRLGIDFDLDGQDSSFLGFIPRGNEKQFPELNAMAGQQVTVTGVVEFYHGRAEIVMTSARQLKAGSSGDDANGLTSVGAEFQRYNGASAVCG